MTNLALLIVGMVLGYLYRTLRDFMRDVESKLKEKPKDTGITPGLYHHANENAAFNQSGETGFVQPKTPQQLEWEETERLREQQLNVRVK